jgi:hypothetical protein
MGHGADVLWRGDNHAQRHEQACIHILILILCSIVDTEAASARILLPVTPTCPHCRSTYVTLALEVRAKCFFICGGCAHRWNEVVSIADRQRGIAQPVAGRSLPRVVSRRPVT